MGAEMMRKTTISKLAALSAALVLTLVVAPSWAAMLPVAGTQFPTVGENDPTGGSTVNTMNAPFAANPFFNGSVTSTVISGDPSNPLGGLTFTYQLFNNAGSPNSIAQLALQDFTGFQTDVSYQTPAAGLIPSNATRPAANDVNFNFDNFGAGPLPPGQNSALLVIQTNATSYQVSHGAIIDSGAIDVSIFGPAVPEPTSLGLVALAGGLVLRRRRA